MVLPPGKALRAVLGETLISLAKEDEALYILDADVGSSTGIQSIEAEYPERYLQMGIAEQNMLGVAAGLAATGLTPVVTGFSCFVVGRAFDSIRVLVAQPQLNVKIVGGYAGLLTGMTGKTHQMFNDVALMRTLPNIRVLAPADEVEADQAVRTMIADEGPFYLQTTREPSPKLFDSNYHFELGRAVWLRVGNDVTLVGCGVQTTRNYEAAIMLDGRGIAATVLHLPTVKPLDEQALVEAARVSGLVVVAEEQSVLGGLGGAVAEVLSSRFPVPVVRLGLQDVYGESGPNGALLEKYRLSPSAIAEDVEKLLRERRFAASRNAQGADVDA